jgi:hypothetical protein
MDMQTVQSFESFAKFEANVDLALKHALCTTTRRASSGWNIVYSVESDLVVYDF